MNITQLRDMVQARMNDSDVLNSKGDEPVFIIGPNGDISGIKSIKWDGFGTLYVQAYQVGPNK